MTALLPAATRVVGVREAGRDLSEIDWRAFEHLDGTWFRAIGDRFETFATVGRDLLIIYPAKDVASSVTVHYAKLTNDLTTDAIATEISDWKLPLVLDLAEAVLSAKARQFPPIAAAIERMTERVRDEKAGVA